MTPEDRKTLDEAMDQVARARPFEVFGYEIGSGWRPLVEPLVEEIQARGGSIQQVKEKFGGLRIYFAAPEEIYDELDRKVDLLAAMLNYLCEDCGAEGANAYTGGGWWRTQCEACAQDPHAKAMIRLRLEARRQAREVLERLEAA